MSSARQHLRPLPTAILVLALRLVSFTGAPVSGGLLINSNVIGLNASGTATLPNASGGILIDNVSELTTMESVPNFIAGNGGPGVRIANLANARLRNNLIGVLFDGVTPRVIRGQASRSSSPVPRSGRRPSTRGTSSPTTTGLGSRC